MDSIDCYDDECTVMMEMFVCYRDDQLFKVKREQTQPVVKVAQRSIDGSCID
jgi:hypothetical protein